MEGNHLLVSANRIPRSVSLTVDKLYHATCVLVYCVFTDVCQSGRSVPFYLCTCALVAGPCVCTGVCNIGRPVPVPVYCQWSVLQWPLTLCLYQLDRSAVPGKCLVGQGVPILLAAGKIRACLTHLHVGQTLCDRSLLIACVDPVLGSKYAQIQKLFGLDDFYLQSYFFVSQGEFMAILILVTIQQRQWQWKTLV